MFRGPVVPRTDRDRKWVVFNTLVLHLRPVRVPEKTIRYTHTFGLGGMSLVLVLLLMGTGILMMFVYEPTPNRAHASVVGLEEEILFGRLVRGVHYWSANLLIVVAVLHLLRVFLTGGFHGHASSTGSSGWVCCCSFWPRTSPATCCPGISSPTGR